MIKTILFGLATLLVAASASLAGEPRIACEDRPILQQILLGGCGEYIGPIGSGNGDQDRDFIKKPSKPTPVTPTKPDDGNSGGGESDSE